MVAHLCDLVVLKSEKLIEPLLFSDTFRYPECTFSLEDALTDHGSVKLRSLCKEKLVGGYPSVVAIDINGNREIPAVLQCVENIMNPGNDVVVGEDWKLPRLIIVKSRLLHAEIKKQRKNI